MVYVCKQAKDNKITKIIWKNVTNMKWKITSQMTSSSCKILQTLWNFAATMRDSNSKIIEKTCNSKMLVWENSTYNANFRCFFQERQLCTSHIFAYFCLEYTNPMYNYTLEISWDDLPVNACFAQGSGACVRSFRLAHLRPEYDYPRDLRESGFKVIAPPCQRSFPWNCSHIDASLLRLQDPPLEVLEAKASCQTCHRII